MQASLDHPHVVDRLRGRRVGARPLPRHAPGAGPTLATLIHDGALDASRAAGLLGQVAGALDAAHARASSTATSSRRTCSWASPTTRTSATSGYTRSAEPTASRSRASSSGRSPTSPRGHPRRRGRAGVRPLRVRRDGLRVPHREPWSFRAAREAAVLFAHTNEPPPRSEPAAGPSSPRRSTRSSSGRSRRTRRAARTHGASSTRSAGARRGRRGDLGPPPPPGGRWTDRRSTGGAASWRRAPDRGERRRSWRRPAGRGRGRRSRCGWASSRATRTAARRRPAVSWAREGLGSDLAGTGRRAMPWPPAGEAAPGCTIVQRPSRGQALVVPEDGAIRRWAVRSAPAESSALAVVSAPGATTRSRWRRSRNEFAGNDGAHRSRPTSRWSVATSSGW